MLSPQQRVPPQDLEFAQHVGPQTYTFEPPFSPYLPACKTIIKITVQPHILLKSQVKLGKTTIPYLNP